MNLVQRQIPLLGFGFIATCLMAAFYIQYVQGIEPCPLCTLQRIVYFVLAGLFAIASIHGAKKIGRRVYASLITVTGIVGCLLAGRHVWLQNLPKDAVPPCGPSWDVLVNNFPLLDVFKIALKGSGDCAIVEWQMLGISLAQWSLICFVVLTCLGIIYWLRPSFTRYN